LPPNEVHATREDLLQYFYEMIVIRRMEMTADSLYKKKLVRGFCHLYMGQVREISAHRLKMSIN
jgi:pyruvate dehydrogenase E1 component alpha subunit